MTLTKHERALLNLLDSHGGCTTQNISARMTDVSYGRTNRRLRSALIRAWLMALKRQGFVRYLDDQKPVC